MLNIKRKFNIIDQLHYLFKDVHMK